MSFFTWLRALKQAVQPARRIQRSAKASRRPWHAKLNLEMLEDRTMPSTLTVLNTNDSGPDSLREAILIANNVDHPEKDTIRFNIPGSGVHRIVLTSQLPTVTDPIVIDGYSQPGATPNTNGPGLGSNANLRIELDGFVAGEFSNGLTISAGDSTVQGLAIHSFGNQAIALNSLGGNVIAGNFIGTNSTGFTNFFSFGGLIAVYIDDVPNNVIGGTTPAARNLISLNKSGGNVVISGTGATGNRVEGNLIGTNAVGNEVLPGNNASGVTIRNASGNIIGGTAPGAGNVISLGVGAAVSITGSGATGNRVEGNFLGTDAAGINRLGNTQGVNLSAGASGNTIGGPAATPGAAPGNLISASAVGVVFNGAETTANKVQGNLIGSAHSVGIQSTLQNSYGVYINHGVAGNLIGGTQSGEGNKIAFNFQTGVTLVSDAGSGNAILGNAIYENENRGIDLGDNGATANDPDDEDSGPNGLQNFPVLTSATANSITGTLASAANTNYRIEFFSSDRAEANGQVEGQKNIGFTDVTTNDSGDADFTATTGPTSGLFLTATASENSSNTSEFSAAIQGPGNFLTTTAVSTSKSPALPGEAVTFTATVTAAAGQGTPQGVVFFQNGPNGLDYRSLDFYGMATFTTTALTPGSHAITARYAGGADYQSSTSPAITQVVAERATAMLSIAASPNPSVFGQPVTFIIAASSEDGVFPEGPVTIAIGNGNTIGATLSPTGTTSVTTGPGIPLGTHLVQATYGGSAAFNASTSPAIVLVVRLARTSTWDGGGTDDFWTTAANWAGDVSPASGDALVFPDGAARRTSVNDLAPGSMFSNITFTGGDYAISGNPIALSGNLNQLWSGPSAPDVVALDIALTGAVQFLTVRHLSATLQLDGRLSGTGGLIKAGGGRLILGGDNTYLGSTLVNQGIVDIRTATALGDARTGTTVKANSSLQVSFVNNLVQESLSLAGTLDTLASQGWGGPVVLAGSRAQVNVSDSFALTGTVSGAALVPLIKTGPGALALAGRNTYGGMTVLKAGILDIRNASALGKASGKTDVQSGAALQLQGGMTVAEPLLLSGTLRSLGGNNTWTGPIQLRGPTRFVVDTEQFTINAAISDTSDAKGKGGAGFMKEGEGKLVLRKANSYLGVTDVAEGVLNVQNSFALGGNGVSGSHTAVRDGATLELEYHSINPNGVAIADKLILAGIGVNNLGALRSVAGDNAWLGSIKLESDAFIGVDTVNRDRLEILGPLQGSTESGLGKVGRGVLRLNHDNKAAYAGTISVIAGILDFAQLNALGETENGTTVFSEARLRYSGAGSYVVQEPVTLMENAVLEVTGNGRWGGQLILAGTATIQVNTGGNLKLSSVTGAGGVTLMQSGLGMLTLSGEYAVTLFGYGANGLNQIAVLGGRLILEEPKLSSPAILDLSVAQGFDPIVGTTFTIVDNRTTLSVSGLFAGLKEGTVFLVDELLFQITYRGGDGNDVVLTRVSG